MAMYEIREAKESDVSSLCSLMYELSGALDECCGFSLNENYYTERNDVNGNNHYSYNQGRSLKIPVNDEK